MRRVGLVGLLVAGLLTSAATGDEVGFEWRANTEADLAGYKLYQGPSAGFYTNAIVILAPATNYWMEVSGTNYFALTAFNTAGLESLPTPPLRYEPPPPSVPTEFEGAALWLITERSDAVLWQAVMTNAVPAFWPWEIFRQRIERVPLR